ncbi:unnamed protein product [Pylaiella littoralis]
MKQDKSERFFMPVWSEDELLDCQQAVFSHVRRTAVKEAFGDVGGVPRAVFNVKRRGEIKREKEKNVVGVDVGLLRAETSLTSGHFPTDVAGGALFHIFSCGKDNYQDCSVRFASKFAEDVVMKEVSNKEVRALLGFWGAAATDPKVDKMLGGAFVGLLFEKAAHLLIGLPMYGDRRFTMTILSYSSGTDVLEEGYLSFDFRGML